MYIPPQTMSTNEMTSAQQPSIPEWDQNAASTLEAKNGAGTGIKTAAIAKPTLKDRFNTAIPPHRRYLGLKRRWFLLAVLSVFLALLALIIGLAVGLTTHGGSSRYGRIFVTDMKCQF